ncbi:MAG: HAD-IIB family hydrolase, partial [Nitrospinaceae bacterium]
VKYVLELTEQLSQRPEVCRVDLFTRLIRDRRVAEDYSVPVEPLNEKSRIVRIPCGGGRYLRKELLWNHLDEFIDKTLRFLKHEPLMPFLIHGHYADGGYVALSLASFLGLPFLFTGHSLGRPKMEKMVEDGMPPEEIERKYHMGRRVQVEEQILGNADLVFASTNQEVEQQYGLYQNHDVPEFVVNPPGLDLNKFTPYYDEESMDENSKHARFTVQEELNRFFLSPDKPLILALCRPDKRKNITSLIEAYGQSKDLQAIANLAVFLGIRKNIMDMEENERSVLIDTLLLMDKYDLYGKMAIPKKHEVQYEVPELYRVTALGKGVFVNPALTEPFGLTLLESAACGVPIVATHDGGPVDIEKNCRNGILVDVSNPRNISEAIKRILVNEDLWKTFSQNGIRNVRTFYSWESHGDRYLDMVLRLRVRLVNERQEVKKPSPIARKMMHAQKIVVSDIDNTLTGDPESTRELMALLDQRQDSVVFAVATGRTIDSALDHLKKHGVRTPDILITSVGSEIYYEGPEFPDKGWSHHINQKWDKEKIRSLLAELPFLEPQEPETERNFKISFFMDPEAAHLEAVHDLLIKHRVRYNLIYSHQSFLDILPQRASKGKAIRYLSYKWDIPLDKFLVAGDSGNDEEMLRGEPCGVVVGNYSPEMKILKGKRKVYFARGLHAAGIIEGIRRYRFLGENE